VPEGSTETPVKLLIHLLALMNTRLYKPGTLEIRVDVIDK
jgi:hypothetical protein